MTEENKRTVRSLLRLFSILLFIPAAFIAWDIFIPHAPDPNAPKPNLGEELKPAKQAVFTILISLSALLFIASLLFRRKK